jgi:hypothetical protein
MRIHDTIMVFLLVITANCFHNHLKHNTWQSHSSHLSTWVGSSCDNRCTKVGGFICGFYFKDCCKESIHCAGLLWK